MKLLLLLIVRISILISNKGSQKCSHSIDFYCNVLKLTKKTHLMRFSSVLIRMECLLNFCKHNVFAKFW